MNKALCGVCPESNAECAICFEHLCQGDVQRNQTVCHNCMIKTIEFNDSGERIHPVTRRKQVMCKCGKPFTFECRLLSLPGGKRIDEKRFEQCKTPQERRDLMTDSTAWKTDDEHGIQN